MSPKIKIKNYTLKNCKYILVCTAILSDRTKRKLKKKWWGKKKICDPDVIRTRNLLIWSQTRYHCATESSG